MCGTLRQTVHAFGVLRGRDGGRCPKRREPRRCCRLRSAPSGASQTDRSTTGRTSGVSLQLDQYIARLALRRGGRCRFSVPVPVARSRTRCHRFTLTRLPVPSVLVPIGNRPHRGQLGWPQIRRLRTIAPSPAADLRRLLTRLPRRSVPCAPEGLPDTSQRVSVSDGYPSARSDPTPSQLPAPDADSSSPPPTCVAREPGSRWPVNLSCPDPACTS